MPWSDCWSDYGWTVGARWDGADVADDGADVDVTAAVAAAADGGPAVTIRTVHCRNRTPAALDAADALYRIYLNCAEFDELDLWVSPEPRPAASQSLTFWVVAFAAAAAAAAAAGWHCDCIILAEILTCGAAAVAMRGSWMRSWLLDLASVEDWGHHRGAVPNTLQLLTVGLAA